MTDLLSLGERLAGRVTGRPAPPVEARPLPLGALMASLGAAVGTMLVSMAVAVVGWFLADGGAHGETTDALRVGATGWLVGHGSGLTVSGTPMSVVPLGVTALLVLVVYRFARWAGATSELPEDDRALGLAAVAHTGSYVVIAVVTCVLVGGGSAAPGLGRTLLATMLLSGVAGTLGLAAGCGRLRGWVELVPPWIRAICFGAAAITLVMLAAASLLVATSMVLGLNEAAGLMSQLGLGTGDTVTYALVALAVVPNAVVLGAAYLLGPGFAVGTGTVVSPTVVSIGAVPAFPLLAALPDDGATHPWLAGVMGVPVLAAIVGAALAQRHYAVTAWDSAALRGFGSGLGGAVLVTAVVAIAGGPMGTGRMADIGAPLGEVLVAAVMAMCTGGLVAGLVTAWWQRRRAAAAR